ncbi:hypothetical protein, partial [Achromobacter xylosoxidans]|uniref:hypothetical protein n=2 Tax=Alcaligenes xylosoxydans xylosoxydans TaxID=85698 RepID=UPI001F130032
PGIRGPTAISPVPRNIAVGKNPHASIPPPLARLIRLHHFYRIFNSGLCPFFFPFTYTWEAQDDESAYRHPARISATPLSRRPRGPIARLPGDWSAVPAPNP